MCPNLIFRPLSDQNAVYHQQHKIQVEFYVVIPSQFSFDQRKDNVCIEFGAVVLGSWKSDRWKMTIDK